MKKDLNNFCKCDCGNSAPIAKYTSRIYGWIKGQPKQYIHGHHNRGLKLSEDHKRKISIANKGQIPWFVGTNKFSGKNNPMWKGDKVGYSALHEWVHKKLAKPLACNLCSEVKPLDLANKSGEYKRDLTDWIWLCRKCHVKYDHVSEKRAITMGFKNV